MSLARITTKSPSTSYLNNPEVRGKKDTEGERDKQIEYDLLVVYNKVSERNILKICDDDDFFPQSVQYQYNYY